MVRDLPLPLPLPLPLSGARQAAADDLAKGGEVGLDAPVLLRAAVRDAEARHHLGRVRVRVRGRASGRIRGRDGVGVSGRPLGRLRVAVGVRVRIRGRDRKGLGLAARLPCPKRSVGRRNCRVRG